MQTTGPTNGLITKKFNLKSGGTGDRIAFFVKARNGVAPGSVSPSTSVCSGCNVSDYTVIGTSGNDSSCDGDATTTDGTDEAADTGSDTGSDTNDQDENDTGNND